MPSASSPTSTSPAWSKIAVPSNAQCRIPVPVRQIKTMSENRTAIASRLTHWGSWTFSKNDATAEVVTSWGWAKFFSIFLQWVDLMNSGKASLRTAQHGDHRSFTLKTLPVEIHCGRERQT